MRIPDKVRFQCEECGREYKPRPMRRQGGICTNCDGEVWALIASYVDYTRERSTAGTIAELITGSGWDSVQQHVNEIVIHHVSRDDVKSLMPRDLGHMEPLVAEFIRARHHEEMESKGATNCTTCRSFFVPHETKEWTQAGFCSKLCWMKSGAFIKKNTLDDLVGNAPAEPAPKTAAVSVTCSSGHTFEVMASFSGCRRPCPDCGEKCDVP